MHVTPWLIHVNAQQNPLQYCKVISLQLIKISGEKKKSKDNHKEKDLVSYIKFNQIRTAADKHILRVYKLLLFF